MGRPALTISTDDLLKSLLRERPLIGKYLKSLKVLIAYEAAKMSDGEKRYDNFFGLISSELEVIVFEVQMTIREIDILDLTEHKEEHLTDYMSILALPVGNKFTLTALIRMHIKDRRGLSWEQLRQIYKPQLEEIEDYLRPNSLRPKCETKVEKVSFTP